ncbi:MAG: CsbD family protein [Usitatibacter sp.]
MNTDQMHGHWREVKGWALEHLGRVTNDPWKRIAGRRERLLGRLEASLAESRRIAEASFPAARAAAPVGERRRAAAR